MALSRTQGSKPADASQTSATVIVDRVLYRSEDNDFAVVVAQGSDGEMRLKGPLSTVAVGESVEVDGSWSKHAQHGYTFSVKNYKVTRPTDLIGIERFISHALPGIGPKTAEKIVKEFGADTLQILDTQPARLLDIPGISAKKLTVALKGWEEEQATRRVMLFLTTFGLTPNLAGKIYRAYGEAAPEKLKHNPYIITELDRIGFRTADELALKMGIPVNHPYRIDAGLVHVLKEAEGTDGHCFLPVDVLLTRSREALKLMETPGSSELVAERVGEMGVRGKIIIERGLHGDKHVYTPRMWRAETRLANRLRALCEAPNALKVADRFEPKAIDGMMPTDDQWRAIRIAMQTPLSILTGSPGTGKCLFAGTLININNTLLPIEKPWETSTDMEFDGKGYWSVPHENLTVVSVDEAGKQQKGKVVRLYKQEVKEILRHVTLQGGSNLKMTKRHRLLGPNGWTNNFAEGDLIAVPSILPFGEKSQENRLMIATARKTAKDNATLSIPDFVLQSNKENHQVFLDNFFAVAGHVEVEDHLVTFNSASELALKQLALMLGRFGIIAHVKPGKANKTRLFISGNALHRFHKQITIADKEKQRKLNKLVQTKASDNVELIPTKDILPHAQKITGLSHTWFGVGNEYTSGEKNAGRATAEKALERMRALLNYSQNADAPGHKRYSLLLENISEELNVLADELERRLQVDIIWIPVTNIEEFPYTGWVYDMEVEHYHNYVAEGIITHNTASVKAMLDYANAEGVHVELCAPTGKAAKRIKELTGHKASTIHRLLGWQPYSAGGGPFVHNADNPLSCDLLVVDEASMLDLHLADSLFQAVGKGTHVLLVGDTDQLASVSAGRFLDDVIVSKCCPTTHLHKIFRQAAKSMIIQAAYAINKKQIPSDNREKAAESAGIPDDEIIQDLFIVRRNENHEIVDLVIDYAAARIPRNYGWNPIEDIQVIVPQKTTSAGADAINIALQSRLNPHGTALGVKGFRVGDKLLNTRNDHTNDVMNGEFAIIREYDASTRETTIDVDGREIVMGANDLTEFYQLAYAVTIHKMQGSSAKAIIIPVSTSYFRMLSKNLLYTAVTRAEQLCMIIGHPKAIAIAVNTEDSSKRYTALAERLLDPSLSGQLV